MTLFARWASVRSSAHIYAATRDVVGEAQSLISPRGLTLDGAVAGERGGYAIKVRLADQGGHKPWENLVGWIEEQGEGEAQGFALKVKW